jgi:DNA-binding transcriptional MerR regulator
VPQLDLRVGSNVYRCPVSAYRISELAELSGVPATTLRFYESAGLLPAARTPGGYRTYDDVAVERLAFISSAKLLGLALEDIGELLPAWETGVCASVRARLQPLVDERIADADRRIAELRTFLVSLHRTRAQLSGPAPAGACGPDCGCVTAPAVDTTAVRPTAVAVTLSRSRDAADGLAEQPVACTLTGDDVAARVVQWRELLEHCQGRADLPDGLALTFPATTELAGAIAALAAAEQQCCSFFDFALQLTSSSLVLTVRAPDAAADLLAELFGAVV